ncbi:MAG: STAS domain-containing protein [Kiritimatiellae bacterium]|nr:STAS domain-containing protein [Kiritimatiellia bacterium]
MGYGFDRRGWVDYISSAGLRVLLATQKRMKPAGGAIRVINISKTVQEIFDITGFTGIFTG